MEKSFAQRGLMYLIGMALLSLGIVLSIKASFGVSVASSSPYVLSLQFTNISLGVFTYMIQGMILVLTMIVMKRIKLIYLLTLVSTLIFSVTLDLFELILRNYGANMMFERIFLFVASLFVIALGVLLLINSGMPPLPLEMSVKEFSSKYDISVGKVKRSIDVSLLVLACTLSFIFFGTLVGVHVGTIISAFAIGTIIDFYKASWEKYKNKPVEEEAKPERVGVK